MTPIATYAGQYDPTVEHSAPMLLAPMLRIGVSTPEEEAFLDQWARDASLKIQRCAVATTEEASGEGKVGGFAHAHQTLPLGDIRHGPDSTRCRGRQAPRTGDHAVPGGGVREGYDLVVQRPHPRLAVAIRS